MTEEDYPDSPAEAVRTHRKTVERLAESDLAIAEDAQRVLDAVEEGKIGDGG